MAQKHDSHAAHPSVPPAHVTTPTVTSSDRLLSSVISLPSNPRIAYVTFVPTADGPGHELLELGRRQLVSRNDSLGLLESILPHAHIDGTSSTLHAFMFTSVDHSDACLATLKAISLDGLVVSEVSFFDPQGLYPCSFQCAARPSPCHFCHGSKCPTTSGPDFSAANLLPRKPLRIIYSRFINALRSRIIDDITRVPTDAVGGRSAHRLMDGFLLSPSPITNEWATDWLSEARLRPLVHCQLEVNLSASRLEVYSHFQPTDFLPLDFGHPLTAGTPITLLPFGVPSYYLSTYTGPTSSITSQFEQSLTGLGAGEWKTSLPALHSERRGIFRSGIPQGTSPSYVIAWIAVQNKQGEDKGIAIIWPLQLSLAFTASSQSIHARRPLSYLPDLLPQLQPSPPPPPPSAALALSSFIETGALTAPSPLILGGRSVLRRLCASPTLESVRAFRCLTLSKSSRVDNVVLEIGTYVESVAKERERERERIRRERENAQSSASPRTMATPSTSTSVLAPSSVTITGNSPLPPSPVNGSFAGGEAHILPNPAQTPTVVISDTNLLPPYPSPPSTLGKTTTQPVISSVEPAASSAAPASASQIGSVLPTLAPPFDPFGSIDGTWTQPPNDFMNLGESYDMNFDMNVDDIGAGGGGGTASTLHTNMDFEDGFIFTEDDFDFFDRPSGASRTSRSLGPPLEHSALTLAGSVPMGLSPSALGDGAFSVTAAFTPGQQQSSPFTVSGAVDSFTPRFPDLCQMQDLVPGGTDALPSPGSTPNSQPATPQVKLLLEHNKGSATLSNFFDPIPFAQSHRLSDSKYHMGKFALPSPPDEEDRTQPIPHLSSPSQNKHWKDRYNAATDYRIGLVKKLVGIKRKSFEQGSRKTKWHPSWLQHGPDLEDVMPVDIDDVSDTASEDEDIDDAEPAPPSRTTTPPPTYLPHGPELLHMQFSHPHLLPLSKPLRPPGAAVAPMTIPTPVPTSVPTPVSPAAALGATSEKKSLEAAGSMIAREVVENSIFADAWRASNNHCLPHRRPTVWPADVSTLAQIIRSLPALEGPVELQAFLHHAEASSDQVLLQRMDTPLISVGKGDSIVQVLPASLRFWEKLGLTPYAGKKDLTAFLFFEDNGVDKQQLAESWLKKLSTTYSARQLGNHVPGRNSLCSVDGIFALRLDSLRKQLTSLATDLPSELPGLVFYIAVPDAALTLASPLLRQISSAMKRLQKVRSEHPITLQLIPEHHITSHDLGATDFEKLCFSVYHRVPHPVDRTMSRRFFDTGKGTRGFFREPAFALARPPKPVVHFSLGPARTLDVLDRHTFLHVGYRFSACGKWFVAACVDQRGESYDLGSWLTHDEVEMSAILQVWNFALRAARRTNVEWRLVISKLGAMSPTELDAWIHHLSAVSPLCHDLAPFHVTILSVDQNIIWSFTQLCQPGTGQPTTPRRATGKDSLSKSLYVDVTTATTYAVYPTIRIPLSSPPTHPWADCSFIPDEESTATAETPCPIVPVRSTILLYAPLKRPSSSCSTLHIHFLYSCKSPGSSLLIPDEVTHQEITRNYYELAVLASLQGPFGYPILPLHLSALESMQDALRQERE